MLEYFVGRSCPFSFLQDLLNQRASEGWCLHSVVQDAGGDLYLILVRERAEPVLPPEPVPEPELPRKGRPHKGRPPKQV